MPPGAHAYVQILGPVQVVADDGAELLVPSVAQRRLLAVLAIHAPRTLRADFLSELLEVSSGALRTTVSRLRRIVGEAALHTDAHGYRLESEVDSARFVELVTRPPADGDRLEQLDAALDQWHGEALDEFRHEPWAGPEVARLDELRSLALETKAALLIARDRHGEAVSVLEPHIAAFPLRDQPRGLLMRALAAQGRQAEALRVYDGYRRYLAEEVGTEPSPAVRAIERRIATGLDTTEPEPDMSSTRPAPAATAEVWDFPLPGILKPPDGFVGRAELLDWFEGNIVEVTTGSPRALVLGGEPGVGKTAIVSTWVERARREHRTIVVCGRCIEGDPVPLQPFREIVGYLVDHVSIDVLQAHVARVSGELVRLAPQLRRRLPDLAPPVETDGATERQLLFEAVGDLFQAVAGLMPTIVVIEDLHWAEPTTLRLLRFLVAQLGHSPIMCIATHRDAESEQTPEVRATLADLARNPVTRVRHIDGLDSGDLAALVSGLTGVPSDADAGAIVDHLELATAGNPLFASQIVRHLSESGRLVVDTGGLHFEGTDDLPPDIRDTVWQRVSRLGTDAVETLAAGAALGVEFDVEVLANMVDIPEGRFAQVIDAAVNAGLLGEGTSPRTMRFTHAVVAQALYSELHGVARSRVHERAARVLAKSSGQHPQRIVVQLARHWALAGALEEALTWSVAAGDGAMSQLAPAEASRWYAASVDHATELDVGDAELADLTIKLGNAQRRAGAPAARDTLLRAARLAERAGAADSLVQAALLNNRGFQTAKSVDTERIGVIEAALAVVDEHDDVASAQLLALLAQELINTPDAERRRRAVTDAIAIARASSDPTLLARITPAAANAAWEPGGAALRTQLVEDAIARIARVDDPLLEFRIYNAAYTVAIEAADPVGARRSLQRLRQLDRRLGEPGPHWVVGLYDVFENTVAGNLETAATLNDANLELGLELGQEDAFAIFAGQFYQYRSFAWRVDELFPMIETAAKTGPDLTFQLAFAILCVRFGRVPEARAILHEGARVGFTNVAVDWLWSTGIVGYAILANELKDAEAAEPLIEILRPYAALNTFNGALSQGCIGAAIGRLLSVVGDYQAAEEHLQAALEVHTAFGWHHFRATGLAALAENRRRWKGELDAFARECVAEAEAIARPRGLNSALEQIRWATGAAAVN